MAGVKISQLPLVISAQLTDLFPVVQGGVTSGETLSQVQTLFASSPTGILPLANGGTNADLTASNGGIFYSTATAGAILSGTATANQVLLSGSNTAPSWSTATYPVTTTINQLLYSSAANTIAGLATLVNGVLITGATGIPALLANSGTPGFVLTANSGAPPSWQAVSASGAITTINGDAGSATPSGGAVTISGGTTGLTTSGSSATLSLTGILKLVNGGTNAALVASAGAVPYSTATAMAFSAVGSSGQLFQSTGTTAPGWTTPTYPSASGTSGKFLTSDGTNIVYSTSTFPATAGAAGTIITSDGTNWITSTSLWPNTVGTNLHILLSNGTSNVYSTPAYPNASVTAGKVIISDGTNYIASTSIFPNTVGTAGQIIRSDGTVNAYSTATFADTYAINTILYNGSINTVSGLPTANSSVLVTSAGGVPSLSTTLPSGLTIPGYANAPTNTNITSMTGLTGALGAPTGVLDSNGNNVVTFNYAASAVNYATITNSSTGNPVIIDATGSDSSVPLNLRSKGNLFDFSSNNATGNANLRLFSSDGTHYVGIATPLTTTATQIWTLPAADISGGGLLQSNGSSVWSMTNTPALGTPASGVFTNCTGYTVANLADVAWTDFSGTIGYTGFSGTPTTNLARYKVIGKTLFFEISMTGTSNATTFTITSMPVAAASTFGNGSPVYQGVNNGSSNYTVQFGTTASSTTLTLLLSNNGAGWTNTGTKAISFSGFYETT